MVEELLLHRDHVSSRGGVSSGGLLLLASSTLLAGSVLRFPLAEFCSGFDRHGNPSSALTPLQLLLREPAVGSRGHLVVPAAIGRTILIKSSIGSSVEPLL